MPSNFLAIAAASSLETFSFRGFGAPSTRSLASFSPRAVTSRTALMVLILFAPASFRMTVNSVFSSAAGAAAPPPAAGAAATVAAAAETLLELLHQLRSLEQGEANDLIFQLLNVCHFVLQFTAKNLDLSAIFCG